MSNPPSVLPPNPYFNGIIYNPTDYLSISGNTVLTYAQASVLFIQKTIADTVTGITDFVNGITTSSILAKTVAATCNLWTNATALINIGSATSTTNLNGGINLARNATGTNATYLECVSGTTVQYIDWHCNSANATDYDCRMIASGGTATTGQGDLSIQSKSFSINSPLTLATSASATTNSQLGYSTLLLNNTTATSSPTVVQTIYTFTPPGNGTWLLQATWTNGAQINSFMLSTNNAFTGLYGMTSQPNYYGQMTYTVNGTANVYFLLQVQVANTITNINLVATRIG